MCRSTEALSVLAGTKHEPTASTPPVQRLRVERVDPETRVVTAQAEHERVATTVGDLLHSN